MRQAAPRLQHWRPQLSCTLFGQRQANVPQCFTGPSIHTCGPSFPKLPAGFWQAGTPGKGRENCWLPGADMRTGILRRAGPGPWASMARAEVSVWSYAARGDSGQLVQHSAETSAVAVPDSRGSALRIWSPQERRKSRGDTPSVVAPAGTPSTGLPCHSCSDPSVRIHHGLLTPQEGGPWPLDPPGGWTMDCGP